MGKVGPLAEGKSRRAPLGFNKKPVVTSKRRKPRKHGPNKKERRKLDHPNDKLIQDDTDTKHVKVKTFDAKSLRYLNQVLSTIENDPPSENDIEILANNVFRSQYLGREASLSSIPIAKKVMHLLLPYLSFENLKSLLLVYQNDYNKAFEDGQVISAMRRSLQIISKLQSQKSDREEETEDYNMALLESENSKDYLKFIENWFASLSLHFANTIENVMKDDMLCKIFENFLILTTGGEESNQASVCKPTTFKDMLKELVENITPKLLEIINLKGDKNNSSQLFILMRILPLLKMYNEGMCDELTNEWLNEIFPKNTNRMMNLPTIPKLFFGLLQACSNKQMKEIIQIRLKGRIQILAAHPEQHAYLYTLILCCRKRYQIKIIIEELLPEFSLLVLVYTYTNILNYLSQKCSELKVWQKSFVKNLMMVLHCFRPKKLQIHFVELLLTQTPYDKELIKNINFNASLVDCSSACLFQNLLKFQDPEKSVSSFLALKKTKLAMLACSIYGKHIMKTFLTSETVSVEHKASLIHSLKGTLLRLSCDIHGSRVVQDMWQFAVQQPDAALHTLIVKELSQESHQLRSHKYGQFIYYCCNLRNFDAKKSNSNITHIQSQKLKILDLVNISEGVKAKKPKLTATLQNIS